MRKNKNKKKDAKKLEKKQEKRKIKRKTEESHESPTKLNIQMKSAMTFSCLIHNNNFFPHINHEENYRNSYVSLFLILK